MAFMTAQLQTWQVIIQLENYKDYYILATFNHMISLQIEKNMKDCGCIRI